MSAAGAMSGRRRFCLAPSRTCTEFVTRLVIDFVGDRAVYRLFAQPKRNLIAALRVLTIRTCGLRKVCNEDKASSPGVIGDADVCMEGNESLCGRGPADGRALWPLRRCQSNWPRGGLS